MDKISDKEKGGIMPIKSHFYTIHYRSEFMFIQVRCSFFSWIVCFLGVKLCNFFIHFGY